MELGEGGDRELLQSKNPRTGDCLGGGFFFFFFPGLSVRSSALRPATFWTYKECVLSRYEQCESLVSSTYRECSDSSMELADGVECLGVVVCSVVLVDGWRNKLDNFFLEG